MWSCVRRCNKPRPARRQFSEAAALVLVYDRQETMQPRTLYPCMQFSEAAALVLVYDHLLGEGLQPHSGPERAVLKHAARLSAAVAALLAERTAPSLAALVAAPPPAAAPRPRHLRVNTLVTTVAAARAQLPAAAVDAHLPDVLVATDAGGARWHEHPLVATGALVLQGKASCMPAHALAPQPGWTVVDCCAAPGNKTSHVAAMVGRAGRVLAFERDGRRCETLRATLRRTHAEHVTVEHAVRRFLMPLFACWHAEHVTVEHAVRLL